MKNVYSPAVFANSGALVAPPASAKDISRCNADLIHAGFPELPKDYADFLRTHNGFAFDSLELYGTDTVTDSETDFELADIVPATEDFNDCYVNEDYLDIDYSLLNFGRWNGDYFTYDPQSGKYQVRSHECITDIWDEYDSFASFFEKEVNRW
jgi:hypothetical protein